MKPDRLTQLQKESKERYSQKQTFPTINSKAIPSSVLDLKSEKENLSLLPEIVGKMAPLMIPEAIFSPATTPTPKPDIFLPRPEIAPKSKPVTAPQKPEPVTPTRKHYCLHCPPLLTDPPKPPIQRPKAEYSNSSPFGIAKELRDEENKKATD